VLKSSPGSQSSGLLKIVAETIVMRTTQMAGDFRSHARSFTRSPKGCMGKSAPQKMLAKVEFYILKPEVNKFVEGSSARSKKKKKVIVSGG